MLVFHEGGALCRDKITTWMQGVVDRNVFHFWSKAIPERRMGDISRLRIIQKKKIF
jgi:hypothetical protein